MLDLFTVIDGFIWFWMQSLHRDVQLMQEFIKTQTNFFLKNCPPLFGSSMESREIHPPHFGDSRHANLFFIGPPLLATRLISLNFTKSSK